MTTAFHNGLKSQNMFLLCAIDVQNMMLGERTIFLQAAYQLQQVVQGTLNQCLLQCNQETERSCSTILLAEAWDTTTSRYRYGSNEMLKGSCGTCITTLLEMLSYLVVAASQVQLRKLMKLSHRPPCPCIVNTEYSRVATVYLFPT